MARWSSKTYGAVTQETQGNATAKMWELLKRGLEAQREVDQAARLASRGTTDKLWPSATDAGKCPRAVGLSLMNIPETNPPDHKSLLNFAYGHAAEEMLTPVLEAAGFTLHREVYFQIGAEPECVSGRIDFIASDPIENALIELKTTSSLSMKLTLEGMKRGEPQQSHDKYVKQANMYTHASRIGCLMAGGQVVAAHDHSLLVYVIKDAKKGQEPIQAFRVDYDQAGAESDIASLLEIQRKAKEGVVRQPPQDLVDHYATKGKFSWVCSYCSYFDYCAPTIKEQAKGAA